MMGNMKDKLQNYLYIILRVIRFEFLHLHALLTPFWSLISSFTLVLSGIIC